MERSSCPSSSNPAPRRRPPSALEESEPQGETISHIISPATQPLDAELRSQATTASIPSALASALGHRTQTPPWLQLEPTFESTSTSCRQPLQLPDPFNDNWILYQAVDEEVDGTGSDIDVVPPRIGACKYCSQNELVCLFQTDQRECLRCSSAGRTCVDEGLRFVWGIEECDMLQKLASDHEILALFEKHIEDPTEPAPASWPPGIPILSGPFNPIQSQRSPISPYVPTWSPASISPFEYARSVPSRRIEGEQVFFGRHAFFPSGEYSDGLDNFSYSPSSPIQFSPRRAASRSESPALSEPISLQGFDCVIVSERSTPSVEPRSPVFSPVEISDQPPACRTKRPRSRSSISLLSSSHSSDGEWWSANEEDEHQGSQLLSSFAQVNASGVISPPSPSPAHKRRRLDAHDHQIPVFKYTPPPSDPFNRSPLDHTDGRTSPEEIMGSDEEALYLSSPISALSLPGELAGVTTSIVVTSAMTVDEVKTVLGDHGCTDLTNALDHQSCSEWAISQGGFSDIYSGKLKDGRLVAIKALRLLASSEECGKQVKHATKELHTWSKCRHPNILELLGLVDFRGRLAMVSPWMPNSSIRLYLAARPDADRCKLCYGVSDGLAYLHESTIVHGDLKGANVLLSDQGIPKLADFGNSALGDCSMLYTKTNSETSLSPRWTAPEIFNGGKHSYAADVFALGMTLLETITGDIPYHELEQDLAVIMAIGVLKKLPKRSEAHIPSKSEQGDALWSLLTKCWSYLPEDRPTATEIRDEIKGITPRGLT